MAEEVSPFQLRAVVQRVSRATVLADGLHRGTIGHGLLVLLGVGWAARSARAAEWRDGDPARDQVPLPGQAALFADVWKMIDKILCLRTFSDSSGKMNLSLNDTKGGIALVSQFTLFADLRKGTRPGFQDAAPPALARVIYDEMCRRLTEALGTERLVSGVFGADMSLDFVNDGPVTYVIDVRAGKVVGAP